MGSDSKFISQFAVFPCYSVDEQGVCLCNNGASCTRAGKHPKISDNLNAATTDPSQIEKWRQEGPVNFGVPTGLKNGIFVLDIDCDKGGRGSLEKLIKTYGPLPETRVVATGNGTHYYFAYPGWSVKSDSNTLGPEYPGLDTRGDGGYVIGPGSRHYSGASYNLLRDCAPVEAPSWLLDLLKNGHTTKKAATDAAIPKGQRDNTLTSLAGKLRRAGLDFEAIEAALLVENSSKCKPPLATADVKRIARSVSRYEKGAEEPARSPLVVLSASDLLKRKYKPREPILLTPEDLPVFQIPSINQIHAYRGVGKTQIGLGLARALAAGEPFLAYRAPRKFRVLYIEGELPGSDFQARVRTLVGDVPNFMAACYEDQAEDYRAPLASVEGRLLVEAAIAEAKAEVVFFDSISALANLDANKEESWLALCEWLMKLRKMGLAIFYLQHDGKTGLQRGHSKHEDFIDRSMWLRWEQQDYEGEDGLKCILGFDKNRPGPLGKYKRLTIELDRATNEWTYAEAKPGAGSLKRKGGSPGDRDKEAKLAYIKQLRAQGVMEWPKIADAVNKHFERSRITRDTARKWFEDSQVEDGVKEQLALKEGGM